MTLDTAKFAAIVADAKAKAANNAKWERAIQKAADAILSNEIKVHTFGAFALVSLKNGVYKVNGGCECKAAQAGHRERYHRAAAKLSERYEAARRPPLLTATRATRERHKRQSRVSR